MRQFSIQQQQVAGQHRTRHMAAPAQLSRCLVGSLRPAAARMSATHTGRALQAAARIAGLLPSNFSSRYHSSIVAAAAADVAATATQQQPGAAAVPHPPKMSGAEVREAFLSFFEGKGHARLPSSSLVPEDPTVLLTIAGMLQFKPVFLGQAQRKVPRATTTQKCVRTNDIENVGVTARHHTFFEMLGNFSFGDYFKKEAICWAWQLSTGVYGLPPERVWVSVYEGDEEALALWRDVVGVHPSRIRKMGAADNFWASGPTGPCGPCSELYYDFHPERGQGPEVSLEDDSRFIEFYNLVFMELNRDAGGALTPLAARNIDTGMGLERMAQILQGVPNNYETDLIFPIVARAAELAGVDYAAAAPAAQTALKVIGDHVRAVVYLLSDGVLPSNVGRGYVVRRLLRRVVMKGRLLGIQGQFTPAVAEVAIRLSAQCDPAVAANAARITAEMGREEAAFTATLGKGQKQLDDMLARALAAGGSSNGGSGAVLPGADAFLLYDSFGFPLELTQELAEAAGVRLDQAGFEQAMAAQRARSSASREAVDLTADGGLAQLAQALPEGTSFEGYGLGQLVLAGCRVVGLLQDKQPVQEVTGEGVAVEVLLDRTPFYAESGGQVADIGYLRGDSSSNSSSSSSSDLLLEVSDVQKGAGGRLFVHSATLKQGSLSVGQQLTAEVDQSLRRRIRAHHTATHLLQAALRQVLGPDTCQQGSLVEAGRLRFDFNLSRAMTAEEVAAVERLVNGWVADAAPATTAVMGLEDARAAGATAMFGEKYDDVVRVVEVPGVSMELCGGTHVSNTSEIGAFKVVCESGVASGVRRIEAVAGQAAVEYLQLVDGVVRQLAANLRVKAEDVPARVVALQEELKAASKQLAEAKAQLAVAKAAALASQAQPGPGGAGAVLVEELPGLDAKALQEAAVSLLAQLGDPAAVLLASRGEGAAAGKVSFVAAISPKVVRAGLQAGKLVGAVAKVCGGGGGGKPGLAQAGGKDATQLPQALQLARETIMAATFQ
ncbi:tRNA synthetases class II (A)-domain-containing protein [Scenedesmus sp. NREL 46B-D3]|nr:tRNA synthetases class II (A)-domain-containing protein [Scenedesmus sp. NREL 46B-D3]